MPIEIKINNTNDGRVDVKVIKSQIFETNDLRKEIIRRARAIKLK